MFSDLRRRQFSNPREFIDGGFWHPEKLGDLHHGQDFSVPHGAGFRLSVY